MANATDFTGQEDLAFDYCDVYEGLGFSCRVFYRYDGVAIETTPGLPEALALCLALPPRPAHILNC